MKIHRKIKQFALKELKDEGKIKAIGVSNFSLEQLKEANKDGYVDVVQLEYNLLHRENEEVMKYAENNITFIPYFPLASGILAVSMRKIKRLMIIVHLAVISNRKYLMIMFDE